jgi:putative Holliday junction resolvase
MNPKEFLQTSGKFKKLLAIDFGKKYIGFASCDPLHISVYSVETLLNEPEKIKEFIVGYFQKESVACIVLGFPFNDENDASPFQESISLFKGYLETFCTVPIYLQDESFSTVEAAEILRMQGKKKKDRSEKGKKDAIAACVILQRFLQENT